MEKPKPRPRKYDSQSWTVIGPQIAAMQKRLDALEAFAERVAKITSQTWIPDVINEAKTLLELKRHD